MLIHSWRRVVSTSFALAALLALAVTWAVAGSAKHAPIKTLAVALAPSPDINAAPPVSTAPSSKPAPPDSTPPPVSTAPSARPAPAVRAAPSVSPVPSLRPVAFAAAAPAAILPKTIPFAPRAVRGPTSWTALNQAIRRIPRYRPGVATWTVSGRYGHWGTTDLANGRIYISPAVPASKLYSVVAHEYGHALASANYRRQWHAMDAGIYRWFGADGVASRERATDCMAIAQGATWTHYSPCRNAHWMAGARILLAGKPLP